MDKHYEKLWEKAFACLRDEDKPPTDPQQLDKRTFLLNLTRVIEDKRRICVDKEWTINRGDRVISIREIFGKWVSWINKFKEAGDLAIQYDPFHAALPWAAVRFVLEAVVNEYETNEALLEGLEYVTGLIARYAMVEDLYLNQISPAKDQLSVAIVRLYTAVLIYLARASRFYSRHTIKRGMKATFQPVKHSVDAFFQKMRAEEANVNDLARILDAGLLRKISSTMEDSILEYHRKLDALNKDFQDLRVTLSSRPLTQQVSTEHLLTWIDGIFTKEEYERASSARLNGTCNWIFKQSEYHTWISSPGREDTTKILWIYGSAGFGKSILCARLIDYLRNDLHKPVAYFFCSFSDDLKRQPRSILRSWIAQLILDQKSATEVTKAAYLERQSSKATEQDLWLLFKRIHAQVKDCLFVVDGYDECVTEHLDIKSHATSTSRVAFLRSLMSSIEDSKSRLLLVSRDDPDIREQLAEAELSSRSYEIFRLRVNPDHTREDVMSFSKSVIKKRLPKQSEDLQLDLGLKAAEKCEGMFLWVRLLRERLSPLKNAQQLKKMISDTPAGLDQAYERDLKAIHQFPEEDKDRAVLLLWWTLHAVRPLTVQEVTEALLIAMNNEDTPYPVDELPDDYDDSYVGSLRRLCGSLIDIRAPSQSSNLAKHEIQFAHFSVKEYLSKSLEIHFAVPHSTGVVNSIGNNELLAQQCLRYLCYDEFKQESPSTKESFDEKINKYPFLRYAANQWDFHASRAAPLSLDTISLSNKLHDPSGSRWRVYSEVFMNEAFNNFTETLTNCGDDWPAPLYLASHSGVVETVGHLLDQGVDINNIGGGYATALQKAASRGHVDVFELLLCRGADAFIKGGNTGSALNAAAAPEAGPADAAERMVPMLLSKGVEIETRDEMGFTPLHYASRAGSPKTVQLLLDANANIDAVTTFRCTALHIACANDHEQIVSLLLSRGADTALSAEEEEGETDDDKEPVVEYTALHIAVSRDNFPLTQNLLNHGANVNARASKGLTPLYYASRTGNKQLIDELLENGADLNDTTDAGVTALHVAAFNGFETAVTALLEKENVNVNAQDKEGLTALIDAARNGHVKIVNSLLDHDADLEARNGESWTALLSAAGEGHAEVVNLLLNHGADANSQNDRGWSSVMLAAEKDHVKTIRLLLNHDADPNIQMDDGWTALIIAAQKGHVEIVKIFLNSDADPNIQDNDGWTALLVAAQDGWVEIIELLLDNDADPNIQNSFGLTALNIAKHHNREQVVKILLQRGAEYGPGSEETASDQPTDSDEADPVPTSHDNANVKSKSHDGNESLGGGA